MVQEVEGGVFVVVEFLDQAFNFGQGILIFAVFGIDTELIVTPISRLLTDYCLSKVFSFTDFHDWLWARHLTKSREATLSLLLALEEAGIVRRLNPISGPALFRNPSSIGTEDRLNFKKRASLFQYLAR
ncbi:unnamed protein product [Dibothriocephalus latus]|uniref:Uncharacterized protein n=1 Tax=Dibothriocephalus latus TaxID=60516 RepID=A0A3P7R0H8_DIBLA|nr:unnamed protein product [Dibothriocephalus latus]